MCGRGGEEESEAGRVEEWRVRGVESECEWKGSGM